MKQNEVGRWGCWGGTCPCAHHADTALWLSFLSTFCFQQQHHMGLTTEDVTITDERDPDTASQTGSLASERGIDIGRVGSWATDFEKLLTDPIGLRTFVVSSFKKRD